MLIEILMLAGSFALGSIVMYLTYAPGDLVRTILGAFTGGLGALLFSHAVVRLWPVSWIMDGSSPSEWWFVLCYVIVVNICMFVRVRLRRIGTERER
jgi:uncharacterized membrane protein YidH (DUF202 family)